LLLATSSVKLEPNGILRPTVGSSLDEVSVDKISSLNYFKIIEEY
jgi:hypothetical protein